jgi:hypothetical protein
MLRGQNSRPTNIHGRRINHSMHVYLLNYFRLTPSYKFVVSGIYRSFPFHGTIIIIEGPCFGHRGSEVNRSGDRLIAPHFPSTTPSHFFWH